MKKFISIAEYNEIYKDQLTRAFEDKWSREIAKAVILKFANINSDDVLIESEGECFYDILVSRSNGVKFAEEVKYRSYTSLKYPTHLINIEKFQSYTNALNNNLCCSGDLISIWSDGVVWQTNLGEEKQFRQLYQNETTHVDAATDGKKVLKWCVLYKPDHICYVCAEWNGVKYVPYLSDKQIDVDKLNKDYENKTSIELF